jgi:hypothetical protein
MAAVGPPSKRVRCGLLPQCVNPASDLATPALVSARVSRRMRKRALRQAKVIEEGTDVGDQLFPWNLGTRTAAAGTCLPACRLKRLANSPMCYVCNAPNSIACKCGYVFAAMTETGALTEFCRFVRLSTTPAYEEDSPEDQYLLAETLSATFQRPSATCRALATLVCICSFSGRPATVAALAPAAHLSDEEFLAALASYIELNPFWRGGQAHGGLAKADLCAAFAYFLNHYADALAQHMTVWSASAHGGVERVEAVRGTVQLLRSVGRSFKAADYFLKRSLEIIVLAGVRGVLGSTVLPHDLDLIADRWPMGKGTKVGLKLIWPRLRSMSDMRQALRVLQRAFGGGPKKIPMVRISAFLCFWQRCKNGTLHWPLPA